MTLSCARQGRGGYRLGVPGLATFLIEDEGRSISTHTRRALPPRSVEHLLIDQVLPRVLTHRGRVTLHAGSIETGQGAIGFLGASGAGKSTLCAYLARAGFPLLSDDAIVALPRPGGLAVRPTYAGLRLLPGPAARLFGRTVTAGRVAHYTPKRRIDRGRSRIVLVDSPRPLIAIYALACGPSIGIEPMARSDAYIALLRSTFQLHLRDPDRSRRLFEGLAMIVEAIPVRRLTYPRDFDRLPEVRAALEVDVARIVSPASSAGCACS